MNISKRPRDNIKYHGLIRRGETCYLNSVLQVLFMTKEFREAVRRFSEENPHTEVIDHQLKALFDDLQKKTASTYNITKKLGITNVNEHCDAAEYFERVLTLTSPEASKIFYGLLANRITCHECHTEIGSDAPFCHLPLSLVDSCSDDYRLVSSIKEFFRPSVLCGENQMHCDKCDDRVDATLTNVIKHHPDVLILLLKRFQFNYECKSYVKINCFVEVPYTLQLSEFETYELYAVVDHFGDLRGGHYSAAIRIQMEHEDRWCTFDGSKVTLQATVLQKYNTEKSQTAYLLFYRNKKDIVSKDLRNLSTSESFLAPTNDNNDKCKDTKNKHKREGKESQGRDEKHATKRKALMENLDDSEGVQHKDMKKFCFLGPRTAEKIGVTDTTQKDAEVGKQNKGQENERDTGQIQIKNSSKRAATSKKRDRRTERQGGNQGVPEAACGSKTYTHNKSTEAKNMTESLDKTSQSSIKGTETFNKGKTEQKSDISNDSMNTLLTGIKNLRLIELPVQKQLKEKNTPEKQKATKMPDFPDIELEVEKDVKTINKRRYNFIKMMKEKAETGSTKH